MLLALAGIGLAGLLGWREWAHRRAGAEWAVEESRLRASLRETEADLADSGERIREAAERMSGAEIRIQSLVDRVGNLEAQRDHLRAENERQGERARKAEAAAAGMQSNLEEARHQLLEARERPAVLESQLEAAHARIDELEQRLDARSEENQSLPRPLELAGLSGDGTVFALAGDPGPIGELPLPVHLCRAGGIVLDGWMHREEEGRWIGHVDRWHTVASTLVKGEKVFIVPGRRDETVP